MSTRLIVIDNLARIRYGTMLVFYCHCNKLPQIGIKEHTFIHLQFWRLDVQNQFYWDKVKVFIGLLYSGGS